ncbi:MAG: RteC domain-containing protein [Flavobacteriaceae bacterium]|nr:RteC domain-containing protein [Flavobacteriaceae bacterium]
MELALFSKELQNELDSIQHTTLNTIKQSDLSIILCRNLLLKFKKYVVRNKFTNVNSEIEFFKQIKQIPFSNLVYFSELRSFETQFPRGNLEEQKKTINKKISKLNRFFIYNMDFVQYIEQDQVYMDDRYFTKAYLNNFNVTHSKYYYRDPDFSTSHDLLLAKIKANKNLIDYLEIRLKNVGRLNGTRVKNPFKTLQWTASKSAAVELMYALDEYKAINYGKSDLKETAAIFEYIFNFNLGDFYKTHSENKSRKISRIKFLDDLSRGLLSRMDKDDG